MSHSFKQIAPTDHFGWHAAYLEVYERLFKSVGHGSVLEIGCDGGGGILSYEEFFSRAGILLPRRFVSCDISPEPDSLKLHKSVMRTHFQLDAYTQESLSLLSSLGPFSLMIDDGPHTLGSQQWFVQNYPCLLTGDGLAIVEDIQDIAHIQELAKCVREGFMGYAIDLRHVNGRYDDLLFVIQRK